MKMSDIRLIIDESKKDLDVQEYLMDIGFEGDWEELDVIADHYPEIAKHVLDRLFFRLAIASQVTKKEDSK